jgi:hypothetical protein
MLYKKNMHTINSLPSKQVINMGCFFFFFFFFFFWNYYFFGSFFLILGKGMHGGKKHVTVLFCTSDIKDPSDHVIRFFKRLKGSCDNLSLFSFRK